MERCSNSCSTCMSGVSVEWDLAVAANGEVNGFGVRAAGGGSEPKSLKWESCWVNAIVPSSTTVNITHIISKNKKTSNGNGNAN